VVTQGQSCIQRDKEHQSKEFSYSTSILSSKRKKSDI